MEEPPTTHDFAQAGTYPVTLEVADGAGSTHTVTHQVAVSTSASPLSFRSGARSVANTTSPSLTVPSNVRAGDGLILFATLNITTTTVSGPSGVTGWTPVANVVTHTARTMVWKKVAAAGDAGRTLRLPLSTTTKVALNLVAYGGTSPADPVAAFATRSETTAVTSHLTPTVTVTNPHSWLLSYWADKSSATTNWTAPTGVVVRDELIGSGSGRITLRLQRRRRAHGDGRRVDRDHRRGLRGDHREHCAGASVLNSDLTYGFQSADFRPGQPRSLRM
jgi:hypothetical protein